MAASILLVWDDPDNDPSRVAGYHVYRIERPGTGTVIRHRINTELVPWVVDTDKTPGLEINGVQPFEEYGGTAVGYDGQESELSDNNYFVPPPPVAVGWRIEQRP